MPLSVLIKVTGKARGGPVKYAEMRHFLTQRIFVIFCEIDKDQMYLIYYKEMFFVISLHLENFSIEKSKKSFLSIYTCA